MPTLINTSKGKKGKESKKTARSNNLKIQQKRERAKVRKSIDRTLFQLKEKFTCS